MNQIKWALQLVAAAATAISLLEEGRRRGWI
jgi:hypothetical protein